MGSPPEPSLQKEENVFEAKGFPLDLLSAIRTQLKTTGHLSPKQVQLIHRKAALLGIEEEVITDILEAETRAVVHRQVDTPKTEAVVPVREKTQKRRRGIIVTAVTLLFLAGLIAGGYVYRGVVLDTLDSWGMTTNMLRDKLKVPKVGIVEDESISSPNETPTTGVETPPTESPPSTVQPSKAGTDSGEPEFKQPAVADEVKIAEKPKPVRTISEPARTESAPERSVVPTSRDVPSPQPDDDKIYTVVPEMPEYPGGTAAVLEHFARNLNYPPSAKAEGITGTVYVNYVVGIDGQITKASVIRGVHPLLDEEALRVARSLSGYRPGRKDGRAVQVQFTVPVRFVLN